jgi:1-acyl-sn-glycerol-3-phosphate acyltransferase
LALDGGVAALDRFKTLLWEDVVAGRRLGFWRRMTACIVKPSLLVLTKSTFEGLELMPREGGVIIVANHLSHFDPLAMSFFTFEAKRWPSFLAKDSLFKIPVFGAYLRKVGQIPVSRGTVDASKALEAARQALRDGESLIIYPEGTTTKEPDLWPMKGKTGAARLWMDTRLPIVPVVTWGPQRMFDPRVGKLRLRFRTPMTMVGGAPLDMSRWADAPATSAVLAEITEHIMLRLRDMLAEVRGGTAPELYVPAKGERK